MSVITIVGGGVIGLMSARLLAMAGRQVRLLERASVGREASWAGGGIVSPLYPWRYSQPVTALATAAQQIYPRLSAELLQATGIDAEYEACGLLMLDADDDRDALAWAQTHGRRMELLAQPGLRQHLAGLGAHWQRGVWMPGIANIRNPRLLKALRRSCEQLQVEIIESRELLALQPAAGRWALRLADGGELESEQVVICAGAWSRRLLESLPGTSLPALRPVRGQMLLYKRPAGELPCIILAQGRYVIPRLDGHILCGSTLEETGFDKSTTQQALQSLKTSAEKLWPVLADEEPLRQWAGLRPAAPNGIPYIGRVPGHENLWINAGQFRNGLVLAPASAALLADLMLEREPALDPRPYQLLP